MPVSSPRARESLEIRQPFPPQPGHPLGFEAKSLLIVVLPDLAVQLAIGGPLLVDELFGEPYLQLWVEVYTHVISQEVSPRVG